MHTHLPILLDTVVETVGLPCLGEEDERDGLTKVVELKSAGTHSVHDGGVVDDLGGDVECSGAEEKVGVGRRSTEDIQGETQGISLLSLDGDEDHKPVRTGIYVVGVHRIYGPKGIADDEEADVLLIGISQDLIRFHLDHLSWGKNDRLAIEGFLSR